MIGANVPKHLVVQARTGFLEAMGDSENNDYKRFTKEVPMSALTQQLVDLGAGPMPVESLGKNVAQDYIEKAILVKPKDWEITTWVSHNAKEDDQTGQLAPKVESAGDNYSKHMSDLAFDAIDKGHATTTYGACHDGTAFFGATHVDPGADYQTAQDNDYDLALSLDNYETVRVAGTDLLNDRGEPYGYVHNTFVINPAQERIVGQIVANPEDYGTTDRAKNPYAGKTDYIMSPKITAGAWFAMDLTRTAKPLIMAFREAPNLQHAWFDPKAPEGGRYYFKFYARYFIFYGYWPLAMKGN